MEASPLVIHPDLPLLFTVGVAAASAAVTWLITWPVCALALHYRVIARTNHRRWNDRIVPLLGGTGIFVSLVALTAATYLYYPEIAARFGVAPESLSPGAVAGFTIALGLVFVAGWIDDWIEISAAPKFLVEVLAAGTLLATDSAYARALATHGIPSAVGYPLLLLWIIGITNAFNFIDGMDGLCSGTAAITGLGTTLCLAALSLGIPGAAADPWTLIIACGLVGAALGFLLHNRTPARIFLGDSGSLVLGFVLAALAARIPVVAWNTGHGWGLLLAPVLLLGYPILDVTLAVLRRLRIGQSIFQGDRRHLHHRLQRLGFGASEVVGTLYALGACFCLVAIAVVSMPVSWLPGLLVAGAAVPLAAIIWLSRRETGHLQALKATSQAGGRIVPMPASTAASDGAAVVREVGAASSAVAGVTRASVGEKSKGPR